MWFSGFVSVICPYFGGWGRERNFAISPYLLCFWDVFLWDHCKMLSLVLGFGWTCMGSLKVKWGLFIVGSVRHCPCCALRELSFVNNCSKPFKKCGFSFKAEAEKWLYVTSKWLNLSLESPFLKPLLNWTRSVCPLTMKTLSLSLALPQSCLVYRCLLLSLRFRLRGGCYGSLAQLQCQQRGRTRQSGCPQLFLGKLQLFALVRGEHEKARKRKAKKQNPSKLAPTFYKNLWTGLVSHGCFRCPPCYLHCLLLSFVLRQGLVSLLKGNDELSCSTSLLTHSTAIGDTISTIPLCSATASLL